MGSDDALDDLAALAQRIEDEELRIAALRVAGDDTTDAVAALDQLKAKYRLMLGSDA